MNQCVDYLGRNVQCIDFICGVFFLVKIFILEYIGLVVIKVSEILFFFEVCCVGILVKIIFFLINLINRWLECIFQVRQFLFDGQSVGISVVVLFEMKQKVIVELNIMEKIEVCNSIYWIRMMVLKKIIKFQFNF